MFYRSSETQTLDALDAPVVENAAEPLLQLLQETIEPVQEDRESRIRELAYRRYQERSGGSGDALSDWLEAEKEEDAR